MSLVYALNSFGDFYRQIPDTRLDQFSRYGWEQIYDYLDNLSDDLDNDIKVDYIGICCEYSEYTSIEDFLKDYNVDDIEDCEDDEEKLEAIREYLEYNTEVICCEEDCILFQDF